MVTVFPLSQDNMLGFTLDGEVDEPGMRKLLMAVEAKVGHPRQGPPTGQHQKRRRFS